NRSTVDTVSSNTSHSKGKLWKIEQKKAAEDVIKNFERLEGKYKDAASRRGVGLEEWLRREELLLKRLDDIERKHTEMLRKREEALEKREAAFAQEKKESKAEAEAKVLIEWARIQQEWTRYHQALADFKPSVSICGFVLIRVLLVILVITPAKDFPQFVKSMLNLHPCKAKVSVEPSLMTNCIPGSWNH
ncbi:hypothetical protein BGZ98_006762, partial [Dissophora globulifera]